MSLVSWFTLLPIFILLSLGPGPNNLLAMSTGIALGPKYAVIGTVGRNVAFSFLMLVSALGLGAIILASAWLFEMVKWAGVLYLFYLGIKTWLNADKTINADPESIDRKVNYFSLMRQEFVVAISNPKAILIFTAIFPQMLNLNEAIPSQFAVMGLTFMVTEFFASFVYAVAGKQIKHLIRSAKGALRLNRSMAAFFVFAGIILSSTSRG